MNNLEQKNSDIWSEVSSHIGGNSQFVDNLNGQPQFLQSQIICEYKNPTYQHLFESQKPQSSCIEQNNSLEEQANMLDSILNFLKNFEEVSSQGQHLAVQAFQNLSIIKEREQEENNKLKTKSIREKQQFNDRRYCYNIQQNSKSCEENQQNYYPQISYQTQNEANISHLLTQTNFQGISSIQNCVDMRDPSYQIYNYYENQNNQKEEVQNLSQRYFQNIISTLKGDKGEDKLEMFSKCIVDIELMCKSKSCVKLKMIPNQINKVRKQQEEETKEVKQNMIYVTEEDKIKKEEENEEIKKKEEEQKQLIYIMQQQCGLCLDRISSDQHISSAQEFFQDKNQQEQYFKANCNHYINKICLANDYKALFQDSIIKEEDYQKKLNKLEKQQSDTKLVCNHCNTFLQFKEVMFELKEYLTYMRSKRKTIECLICYVDYDLEDESISLTQCDHIFCKSCLLTYVISCINQNKFKYEDMKCPTEGCNQLINNYIIDLLINIPEHELLYNRMIRMQIIHMEQKNEKFALCPGFQMRNKRTLEKQLVDQETITKLRLGMPPQLPDNIELIGCSTFFSYNEKYIAEYECQQCKYKSCLKGCEDYHYKTSTRGKNCAEFKKWKQLNSKLDKDILAIFDKNTMCSCPKCNAVIIKNGGCNHITCTMPNCGYEFCFKCQSKWLCWKHLHYL